MKRSLLATLALLLACIAVIGLFSIADAAGNSYYIAPDGNDANACTLTAPCATLPRAVGLAQAGDTVYLRSGVYYSRSEWQISGKTSITVTAYPADIMLGFERPIIDATYAGLGSTANILQVSNSQTVTVSRIEFRNSSGRGISSAGSSTNVTFYQVWVYNIGERCVGLVGSYITLDSSNVFDCALNWKSYTGSGGWPGGVASWWKSGTSVRSDHIAVINTIIQRVYGEGLIFLHADIGSALGVVILQAKSVAAYIDDASLITIDRLYVNMTDPAFLKNGHFAHCIEIGNENGGRAMVAIMVTNSNCYGVENGIYFFCYVAGCGYGDVALYNNRVDARSYAIKINTADSVTGVNVLSGNVFSGTFQLSQPQFWNVASNINTGATNTPTRTPTWTSSPTRTPTASRTPSPSSTSSSTATFTPSRTASSSPTATATASSSPSATQTPPPTPFVMGTCTGRVDVNGIVVTCWP